MEYKELLLKMAKAKGICVDGYKFVQRTDDKDALVKYYLGIIDWSLERNFPPLSFLSEHFSDCEHLGLYINKTFHGETFSHLQAYVFHNCHGHINVEMDYDNAIIPMLYFANNCHMTIGCEQENIRPIRVPLYIFGDNVISAHDNDNIEFIKYDG